jgi:hypothetical protein
MPRSFGLQGVFTSDAIDRAQLTQQYLLSDQADLGTVIIAWSALEHATYVTTALSAVSPIQPPPNVMPVTEGTPGVGILALVGVAVCVAVFRRRK